MAETLSTTAMIKKLEGLLGTKDLTEREHAFVENLSKTMNAGAVTRLTGPQLDWLQDLHRKHFA